LSGDGDLPKGMSTGGIEKKGVLLPVIDDL
jgi:hypothetical protein